MTRGCWVCGSHDRVLHKESNVSREIGTEDLRITDARYGTTLELWRCTRCGFVYAAAEQLAHLDALYAELDDPEYEATEHARRSQMKWLVSRCLGWQPTARRLLDVGAATGLLVEEAMAAGLDAVGIEPSVRLADRGRGRGLAVLSGTLPHPELDGQRFDIVTLVDVIEHVSDPVSLLRAAAQHVDDGGIVVVVTPDVGSVAARLMGKRWWHYRVGHVGYFSKASMGLAAQRAGLARVRTISARWFFPARYLVDRLGTYAGVKAASRWGERVPIVRRALDWVVPLNLLDSEVHVLRRA